MKKIGSIDVAKLAGVSTATVSLVLNGRMHIAIPEATRERVRQAAVNLGYRPNLLARNLVHSRTQTIGVLLSKVDNSFCGRIAQGIQEACLDSDYRVLLSNTMHDPKVELRQAHLLLDHQVDGIVLVTDEATLCQLPLLLDAFEQQKVPCVVVDDTSQAARVDCVASRDVAGAKLAVEHLVKLGHRRIAHLSGGTMATTGRDRNKGYQLALQAAGIQANPRYVIGSSFVRSDAVKPLAGLLALKQRPTAIFAANDELAAEAMRVVKAHGMRIPADIALIGYADYHGSLDLDLTTIRQDTLEMGRIAARRLLKRVENPTLKPALIELGISLVVRQSCGFSLQQRQEKIIKSSTS